MSHQCGLDVGMGGEVQALHEARLSVLLLQSLAATPYVSGESTELSVCDLD